MPTTLPRRLTERGSATRKLGAIERRFDEIAHRRRTVDAEQHHANAEVRRLRDELTLAYEDAELEVGVDGKPRPAGAKVRKAESALGKAEEAAKKAERTPERLAAIDRALEKLHAEHEAFLREHRDELLEELIPAVQGANGEAVAALSTLRDALARRAEIGRELGSLVNATEGDGRGFVSDAAAEALQRDLSRVTLEPPIPTAIRPPAEPVQMAA